MSSFSDRVFNTLGQFNGRLSAFVEAVANTAPDPPRLPSKTLKELLDIAARARTGADAISRSFTLIDVTALDIVDMQVRLQGETARLAAALRDLGDAVERQHFVREAFEDELVALDEASLLVAAAVFPSAVQGLRETNVKLWDFQKIQWKRYTDILNDVVQRGRIPSDQQVRIQAIADDVARAFEEVNTLLNELAESRATDAAALRRRLKQAPDRLRAALQTASDRLEQSHSSTLSAFGSVIKASGKVAEDVAKLLQKLTIPIFPTYEGLGTCCDVVARPIYENIGGVQAFALLNILARLQATQASGRALLDNRHMTVVHVFPDRIYFEADRSLIDDIAADAHFDPAPASLHRFKEGSFKQNTFKKGNLQVTFASRPANRVIVDADMDLYRNAVPHLFGEVLVNHLTGSTTDQFAVRTILDDQKIPAIGGFGFLTNV
jgi:ElaB/YqjD/DUF883 family membrane-anchored ribosome-binding protein